MGVMGEGVSDFGEHLQKMILEVVGSEPQGIA